jgi:hypothetical protein
VNVTPVYVDVEGLLVGWLRSNIPGVMRVVTERPANLADEPPLIEVSSLGSLHPHPGIDAATVDYDCYQVGREACRLFALTVERALLYDLPGQPLGTGYVKEVTTTLGPAGRPYDNTDLRRVGGTCQIVVHAR